MAEKDRIRILKERDRELGRLLTEFEKLSPAEQAADIERANRYLKALSPKQLQNVLNGIPK
jgi:hypothetical protein